MPPIRRTQAPEFPTTFLPARIAKAADAAMLEILTEDELLRNFEATQASK